jgi:hypothetical protein
VGDPELDGVLYRDERERRLQLRRREDHLATQPAPFLGLGEPELVGAVADPERGQTDGGYGGDHRAGPTAPVAALPPFH